MQKEITKFKKEEKDAKTSLQSVEQTIEFKQKELQDLEAKIKQKQNQSVHFGQTVKCLKPVSQTYFIRLKIVCCQQNLPFNQDLPNLLLVCLWFFMYYTNTKIIMHTINPLGRN